MDLYSCYRLSRHYLQLQVLQPSFHAFETVSKCCGDGARRALGTSRQRIGPGGDEGHEAQPYVSANTLYARH